MQITRTQSFQPKFKAQFSKDEETKKILTAHNNQYQVYDTYWAISALNNIDSNDSISLKYISSKNKNLKDVFRVKNERTGAFVDIFSDFKNNLFNNIGFVIHDTTSPKYKKLFGKSKLIKHSKCDEDLDELSGANKIHKEIAQLYLKNCDLETEIYRNTRKIHELDKQEQKARLDYVQNLIDQ